ncbi:MAG: M28 family peptidase [Candidatus Hadarchaeum sp.]|uniref:M28 family metallopeptidase n=1 Tax=Candidatus Hadarchaeum sp. TaxID=2883567 RepID=UPI0031752948
MEKYKNISKDLQSLLKCVDREKAFRHAKWLVENAADRLPSSSGLDRAIEYVADVMKNYRLNVKIDRFEAYNSLPISARLCILSPVIKEFPCFPQCHSASTGPEGVVGSVVYVGAGGVEDYQNVDCRDRIVLTELSYSPPRPEKARIAAINGAKAVIIMNWGPSESELLPRGAVKSVWGNPTPSTFYQIPKIPVVGVSRAVGEYIKQLINSDEEVRVFLVSEVTQHWDILSQPIGVIEAENSEGIIVVGGHIDAWSPGATCNAAGNGALLELSRVFASVQQCLRRDVIFAFWNGHEIPEAAGSTWFVDTYWRELRSRGIAYINVDSPGMKGTTTFRALATPEILEFAKNVAANVLQTSEYSTEILRGKHSDLSFYGVGVPSIIARSAFDSESLKQTNNATLGWWYHSEADTLDKIDIDALYTTLLVNAAYIYFLGTMPVLPFEYETVASNLYKEIARLAGLCKDEWLGLKQAEKIANDFVMAAGKVRFVLKDPSIYDREKAIEINTKLLKLVRILLPITHTTTKRYEQDSYGLSELRHPLPCLSPVIEKITEIKNREEQLMLKVEAKRRLNMIIDVLDEAIRTCKDMLEVVKK